MTTATRDRPALLDKASPVPLYYQLFLRVQSDIQAGIARPGDLLGTERDLQQRYDVSRATVRKALDELHRAGQVRRVTGRGTFVSDPHLSVHAPHLLSLTEELSRQGIVPGTELLAFEMVEPPEPAAAALGARAGTRVRHVKRLRTGDGEPVVVVDHWLPASIPLERDGLQQSLYATLEGTIGARLQEAFHTVSAGAASGEEAELLDVAAGDPVVRFERTTLVADGRPVSFELGTARADRYRYSVHLFRR